jgi:hypothetical protein
MNTSIAPSWCLVSFFLYKKFITQHWSQLPGLCDPGVDPLDPSDVCILMGFLSGLIGIYTEHERARDWVNEQYSAAARWCVYGDGWLTLFAHQGRTVFENFFGDAAPGRFQEVIDGTYEPKDVLKPMTGRKGSVALREPELGDLVLPGGELLIPDHGIIQILSDGDCLRPDPLMRTVVSTVVFRKKWIEGTAFQEIGDCH